MILFIAEKPSMAQEIAKNLPGPISRKDGYIETGGGRVTWLYGHILRQAEPDEYDDKYKVWKSEDLPIVPAVWKLLVTDSCAKQYKVIKELVQDASEIIHAGDPDREGQLLVDEVLDHLCNKKPVKRILLNALDEKSVKKALLSLQDNKRFFNLKQSALARQRADWLIGMNLSRLYTIAAKKAGHSHTFPVGRVKTPTLALVVRREREIAEFKPTDYFTITAQFQHQNGAFAAKWQLKETQEGLDSEGRLTEKGLAEIKLEKFNCATGNTGKIIACDTTEKKEPQRLPFSLSALQIEAGKKFGYSPQTVLETAQALYEKKLTTYPRSDCEFLPESQYSEATNIIDNLSRIEDDNLAGWAANANTGIKSRAWNDAKVTAHHAIIPTEIKCNFAALSEEAQNIYFLIARAYIAQFYEVHTYNQTQVEVNYADEAFKANGKVVRESGWKELYGATVTDEEEGDNESANNNLPPMQKGDVADYISASIQNRRTKSPIRFTQSTLVQAMKQIHKYVRDNELKKQLQDVSGIGTEATRATIINELVKRLFLEEKKKYLYPTEAAYALIDALPEVLTYPDTTAIWEAALHQMVEGKTELTPFLGDQIRFVTELCGEQNTISVQQNEKLKCPECGEGFLKLKKGSKGVFWACSNYPTCKTTFSDKRGKPDLEPQKKYSCPECGKGELRQHSGKNGKFWSCSIYQECKATFDDYRNKPQLNTCPQCGSGVLRKRKGVKGDFWGCNKYPECKATYPDEKGKPNLPKAVKR